MAEEAKDAARRRSRAASASSVAAVLGLYLLIPIVALSAMPVIQDAAGHYTTALGSKFADDPILGIVENLGLAHGPTEILRYYVGVLAAVILLIATNAGPDRRLPPHLLDGPAPPAARGPAPGPPEATAPPTSRSSSSPAIAIITLLPGQTDFLATLYSFGAMLSFTIAHVAVIQLRRKQPDVERHLEAAAERPRLRLRGAADRGARRPRHLRRLDRGDGAQPATLVVGIGWMVLGIAVYVLYRRNQGLPLTETVKVRDAGAARGRGGRVPERSSSPSRTTKRSRRRWSRPRSSSPPSGAAASTSTR